MEMSGLKKKKNFIYLFIFDSSNAKQEVLK